MITLKSGIKSPEGSDNVQRDNDVYNLGVIDANIRKDYQEVVDLATWDAAAKAYATVDYIRPEDGSKYVRCVLSNKDANNRFQTDTWTFYAADGVTITGTITWTLTYGNQNIVVSKVPVVAGVI